MPPTSLPRISVEEYHRLVQTGVLREDDPVELVDGVIVQKMPATPFHAASIRRLSHLFESINRDRWITAVGNPVQIGDWSEPEPDLVLLHPHENFYCERHPRPADAFLIIEVSDSTLIVDHEGKLRIYARAGIAEVWIVNLPECVVEVYSSPTNGEYALCRRVHGGDVLAPSAFPDAAIDTAALLQTGA